MRHAYGVLGIAFVIVFTAAYMAFKDANKAPDTTSELSNNNENIMSLTLTSPVFEHHGLIPAEYTCDGGNTPPALTIKGVPEEAASLILLVDDPDIPAAVKADRGIDKFDHWVLYNLSPDTTEITADQPAGTVGLNSRNEAAYTGPCPPPQYEPVEHRYIFKLYAISKPVLEFISAPTMVEVEKAIADSIIEQTELIGRYRRVSE